MRFVWAAYKKGALGFPEGLEVADFESRFAAQVGQVDEVHVLTALNFKGKDTPVGLVTVTTDGYKVWPRLVWFPWSSSRNKVECVVRWVNETRRSRMVLAHVEPSDQRYMDHLCRYGVARQIGQVDDWFAPGLLAWAYQGRLVKDG